jgi:flagellar basal body-associated protein FliL
MRILIFILLCSSFKIIFNITEIKYNEETKVEKERKLKEDNDNIFIFLISKSFNKNNKIYIDISYKGNKFSNMIDKLFYIERKISIDVIKNFDLLESVLPDKESKCESDECSYKYVIELSEDAKIISFGYKLSNVDYIKVKIYKKKNDLWIILLCAGLGIALLGIGIGLYFYIKNNKRKMSVINEPLSAEDTKDEPVFQANLETTQY